MPAEPVLNQRSLVNSPSVGMWGAEIAAGIGFVVWALAAFIRLANCADFDLAWAGTLFLLAPLVLMPLALRLIVTPTRRAGNSMLCEVLQLIVPPGALLLTIAFLLPAGRWAALLAMPWLLTTVLIGWLGLTGFFRSRLRSLDQTVINVAMIYLPVGGASAVLSRAGLTILGFSDIIVLATAVHFHYAGFLFPLLTSRILGSSHGGPIVRVAAVIALTAIPVLAVGITLSRFGNHFPEWIAAVVLSISAMAVGTAQLTFAVNRCRGVRRLLLVVSSCSLLAAMSMSILFATGTLRGVHIWGIDIPWMLRYHAVMNAFGYALCGMLAWIGFRTSRNGLLTEQD